MTKRFNFFVGKPIWLHPIGDFAHLVKEELVESAVTKVTEYYFYCFCDGIGEVKLAKDSRSTWDNNLLAGFIAYENPEEYVLKIEREKQLEAIRNLSFIEIEDPDKARNRLMSFLYAEGIVSHSYEGFKKKLDEKHEVQTIYGVKTPSGRVYGVYKSRLEAAKLNPDTEISIGFCVIDVLANAIPQGCNVWNDTIAEAIDNFKRNVVVSKQPEKREISKQVKPAEPQKQLMTPQKQSTLLQEKEVESLNQETPSAQKKGRKPKDIIGMVFGKLKVVANGTKPGYVLCECECGTKKEILATNLTREVRPVRSCGCLHAEDANRRSVAKRESMIGEVFGRLRVIGVSDRLGYVICQCECGTQKEVLRANLIKANNPTRSCGCLRKESAKRIGTEYGGINSGDVRDEYDKAFNTNFHIIEASEPFKTNTSGRTGVSFVPRVQKYKAYIGVDCKLIHLGYYDTFYEAVKAREEAEIKYHLPLIEAKNAKKERDKKGA